MSETPSKGHSGRVFVSYSTPRTLLGSEQQQAGKAVTIKTEYQELLKDATPSEEAVRLPHSSCFRTDGGQVKSDRGDV
jgi:hypothetical protein